MLEKMSKQIKLTYLLLALSVIFAVLHNLIYGAFLVEEPVFFFLALIFFLAFFFTLVLNTVRYVKGREPRDLWNLGWLGLFGLIGLATKPFFFVFFVLFLFFLAKVRKS